MTKKQAEALKKMMSAKVLVDYKEYSWLLKNYQELLEDMGILQSKELKKAEEDMKKGKIHRWEDVKRAFHL
ncbi:MAG: hypothetical protein WCT39_04115 [Candidatus Margulisiibacteriota bacterium]